MDGGSAAIAMNHLKRLAVATSTGETIGGTQARSIAQVSEMLCVFAKTVEDRAETMSAKHLSLVRIFYSRICCCSVCVVAVSCMSPLFSLSSVLHEFFVLLV